MVMVSAYWLMPYRLEGFLMSDENDAALTPVRLPRALLQAAKAEATRRDETLSQVVRRSLRAYVASSPRQGDIETAIAAATKRPRAR